MTKPFLVADLFCGAGGSSTGAERAVKALGREMLLVCVNHWPLAIETHHANHPNARHYIADIAAADPVKLVPEGYLDLLMASPECTHFSRARGGKPVNNQSRMNPWAILTWLTKLNVRTVLIENVPEFRDWGPVDANDQPVREMKGIFFEAWTEAIKKCGYKLEYRILNAADYGDATTRKRFFLIARKDKPPVTFPKPTHNKDGSNGNCVRPVSDPLATIVTKQNTGLAVAEAVLVEVNHDGDRKPHSPDEPLITLTKKRSQGLAQPAAKPTTKEDIDPRRLVWIDGVLYKLDILFRMLSNPELAASHSFNDSERKYEFKGTVAEVTKQIGNSVPCGIAAALVGEILRW